MRGIGHFGSLDNAHIHIAQLLKDEPARVFGRVVAWMDVGQQVMRRVGVDKRVRQRGSLATHGAHSSIQQAHQHGIAQLWVLRNVDVIVDSDGERFPARAGQPQVL